MHQASELTCVLQQMPKGEKQQMLQVRVPAHKGGCKMSLSDGSYSGMAWALPIAINLHVWRCVWWFVIYIAGAGL